MRVWMVELVGYDGADHHEIDMGMQICRNSRKLAFRVAHELIRFNGIVDGVITHGTTKEGTHQWRALKMRSERQVNEGYVRISQHKVRMRARP
jgi:hypothetical protein